MNWLSFDVEVSPNCNKDYVTVHEIRSDGSRKNLGKFCGNTKPGYQGMLVGNSNKVAVTFSSDDAVTGTGWFIEWNGVPGRL